jgi:hypothetical protein
LCGGAFIGLYYFMINKLLLGIFIFVIGYAISLAFSDKCKKIINNTKIKLKPDVKSDPMEYILCAAICNPIERDMANFPLIFCGHRHNNILWQSALASHRPQHQGFLTSKGRFVDRKEALVIALKANQVLDVNDIRGNKLFSEDLY